MSIMQYNGSAVLAMKGKNCVGIASDLCFGVQGRMITTNFRKTFRMQEKLYLGLTGLATDVQTLHERLEFRLNMYKLREGREIKPSTFASVISNVLYAHRFGPYFVEPVVAGLDDTNTPFICGMDLIGAPVTPPDFVCAGSNTEALFGTCETMYRPDMEPEELFEVLSQCLLASIDRDALAGWGAVVTIITPEGSFTRTLKGRQD